MFTTKQIDEFNKLRGKKFKQGLSFYKGECFIDGLSPKFKKIEDLFEWIKNYGNRKTKKSS